MEGDRSHPVGQHRPVERDPVPGENLGLAIERQVLAELGDRDLRQQRLGRNARFDQMGGRRRLGHSGASLRAGVAGAHCLDDAILSRHDIKTAGAVLADAGHLAAAARAFEARGFDHRFDPRQMSRKGAGQPACPAL